MARFTESQLQANEIITVALREVSKEVVAGKTPHHIYTLLVDASLYVLGLRERSIGQWCSDLLANQVEGSMTNDPAVTAARVIERKGCALPATKCHANSRCQQVRDEDAATIRQAYAERDRVVREVLRRLLEKSRRADGTAEELAILHAKVGLEIAAQLAELNETLREIDRDISCLVNRGRVAD